MDARDSDSESDSDYDWNLRKQKQLHIKKRLRQLGLLDKAKDCPVGGSENGMDKFQTNFSVEKLFLDKDLSLHLHCDGIGRPKWGRKTSEVFRVTIKMLQGNEGYLFGKIYFANWEDIVYVYNRGGQHVKGCCDLLTTGSGSSLDSSDYLYIVVDLLLSTYENQDLSNLRNYDVVGWRLLGGDFDDDGNFYKDGKLIDPSDLVDMEATPEELETDDESHDFGRNCTRISNCKGCFTKGGNLMDGKFFLSNGLFFAPSDHEEFSNKAALYNIFSEDEKCLLTISYAFFGEAVQAIVEVVWLKAWEPECGVYGLVAARIDMIDEEDGYEIILFIKEDLSESVPLIYNHPIQLSRSVVAVPISSDLLVDVNLKTKDESLPSARLHFPAQRDGTISVIRIDDIIEVKVTWKIVADR